MRVLLIRHALAEERENFALHHNDDNLRPLLPTGKKKMYKAVKGLRTLLPSLDVIASSPLTRALETATILHETYQQAKFVQINALAPGQSAHSIAAWLQKQGHETNALALVGHEPDLGQLATWLLAGNNVEPFVEFKKSAMLLLEFPYTIGPGQAQLCWLLNPSQLRHLGRR
jgi:phosphohistidine phosphatase